jgi:hypothetical protein
MTGEVRILCFKGLNMKRWSSRNLDGRLCCLCGRSRSEVWRTPALECETCGGDKKVVRHKLLFQHDRHDLSQAWYARRTIGMKEGLPVVGRRVVVLYRLFFITIRYKSKKASNIFEERSLVIHTYNTLTPLSLQN